MDRYHKQISIESVKLFKSKYPIVCAPMNLVSDYKLAIAAHDAGIVPSLTISFDIQKPLDKNLSVLVDDLTKFREHTKDGEIIVACNPRILKYETIKILITNKVSHIEMLENIESHHISILQLLKNNGVKIILKLVFFTEEPLFVQGTNIDAIPFFDAVNIKGPDGASRVVNTDEDLMQQYKKIRNRYPNIPIIVSGGISTSNEIKQFLDVGAVAVCLGTVFAMSKESCINYEKKLSLLDKTYKDVSKVDAGPMKQNSIVFTPTPDNDYNNSLGLMLGRVSKDKGLIFVGKGIDNIQSIKSVAQIVKELTANVQV